MPHLLNVSFEGVEGESLLAAVRPRLAVSTGSACTSALAEPSYVLRALGRSERLSESSLRFGLGRTTSERDIDTAIAVLTREVGAAAQDCRRMNYNELTRRYFETAARAGVLSGPVVYRGAAGNREHGTWVQFDVQTASGILKEARFLAFGCPHTIAVSAWVAEQVLGQPLTRRLPESVQAERPICGAGRETGPPADHRRCVARRD